MSLDRKMQFFIEQVLPLLWDRYSIPERFKYPSKPSDLKCRDISPALIDLSDKAIWVQSKIVIHHWIKFIRKHYHVMVSSPRAFVTYQTYACNVMAYNIKDHYERFVIVCALLVSFGANFYYCGKGQVIQYIPKILEVFFERKLSVQFNTRGGWKRLDKYLLRQEYLSWHDETQFGNSDETNEQKMARSLSFSKKVEIMIKATYSPDYDAEVILVKDIEDDLQTLKITDEVMDYFPEPTPDSLVEFQGVKKRKYSSTDEACEEYEKQKIIEDLVTLVEKTRSAQRTNQETVNEGSVTQQLTETTDANDALGKTGVGESVSSKVKASTTPKGRRPSKKKQDKSKNSANCEFSPINKQLSVFSVSSPQSDEISNKQTTHANSDGGEPVSDNLQTSKETNQETEVLQEKSGSGSLLDASTVKRKTLKQKVSPYSFQASGKGKKSGNLKCSEHIPSNKQSSAETKQITKIEILQTESSSERLPDAPIIKRNSTNKKLSASIFNNPQSEEANGQNSVNLENVKSVGIDQPTKDAKEIMSEIVQDNEPSRAQQSTEENGKQAILNIEQSASVSDTQKVANKQKMNESVEVASVSNDPKFTKETDEHTARANAQNSDSLNYPKSPQEKLQKTSEKTEIRSPESAKISKGGVFNSKKEAVAEIKNIVESLAPKLEELAVVIATLLWDLRRDI